MLKYFDCSKLTFYGRVMTTHRTVRANGIDIHLAEAGSGPPVVLLHGFPELWYSWRHQLPALAAAGYHAIAPDVRGYGQTTAPADVSAYGMRTLVDDVVGLLDALGAPTAYLVGHDWGAQLGWACVQLEPARFPAYAALSVPYHRRSPVPMTEAMRQWAGDRFNWLVYFQEPGVAEAELEADPRRTLRLIMYGLSGEGDNVHLITELPAGTRLLDAIPEPATLPAWLTEEDLSYYAAEFARTGFRGGLNRYRNVDRDWHELPELGTTRVEQPVLLITGEHDTATRFADWDAMREFVPNSGEPLVLAGAGHWIQQERADQVNAALVDFLAGK